MQDSECVLGGGGNTGVLCLPHWMVYAYRVLVWTGERGVIHWDVMVDIHWGLCVSLGKRVFRVPGACWEWCVQMAPFVLWRWAEQAFS